jgi:hypothetical protein
MSEKKEPVRKKVLTKSNYLLGLQCSKLLHVKVHDKGRIPEPDDMAMYRFRTGDVTEELAKTLFPDGIDMRRDDFLENLEVTKQSLELGVPLFEPGFKFDQLFSRGDVLVPVEDGAWDIVEMKSATKVKEVNLHDVSFQKVVYERCGLKIRKCFLMYINKEYSRKGEIEPKGLFKMTDITEEVKSIGEGIEGRISAMLEVINNPAEPSFEIGKHCKSPYECPLKKECWADLPGGNILEYYKSYPIQCFQLGDSGRVLIDKIPDFYSDNYNPYPKQIVAKREGQAFEKRVLSGFFNGLEYPLYFLDIKAVNPAIPSYNGMKPYQKFPFIFYIKKQDGPGSKIEDVSFLADGKVDPRYIFLKILKDALKDTGTILVYDKTKESSILKGLAWNYPDFKSWIQGGVLNRIQDLWGVFENFHYFDIEGVLENTIKYNIPKITKTLSHDELEIKNGEYSGLLFEKMALDESISLEEKKRIRMELRKLARANVDSMVYIVDVLRELSFGK